MKPSAILLVSCPDAKGEVAFIADFVYRHGGNILHADEHADSESGLFLMRVEFDPKDFDIDLTQKDFADFARQFEPTAAKFQMNWRLALSSDRPRMIIFVSKYDHCLVDLLYRHQSGELACEIPLIISNHPDNQAIADFYKIPYAVISVREQTRSGTKNPVIDQRTPSQFHGAGALHADSLQRVRQSISAAHHQHSSLVSSGIHRRAAVSSGIRARGKVDWSDQPLRDGSAG
jgi:formyltetrahydrofolate hydrolase